MYQKTCRASTKPWWRLFRADSRSTRQEHLQRISYRLSIKKASTRVSYRSISRIRTALDTARSLAPGDTRRLTASRAREGNLLSLLCNHLKTLRIIAEEESGRESRASRFSGREEEQAKTSRERKMSRESRHSLKIQGTFPLLTA